MNTCSYHPTNRALVRCRICGRPLCPKCDHRIKGYAFCQDCIVRGVELLQSPRRATSAAGEGSGYSPVVAVFASLVPGLGAVYNRQNAKAFLQFIVICGLFQIAGLTGLAFFSAAGAVFYFYSMVDAYRTARAARTGIDPAREDERLRRFMQEHVRTLGGMLVGLGLLFLLTDVFQLRPPSVMLRMWPLLLVGLGTYFLVRQWWSERRDRITEPPLSVHGPRARSLFSPSSFQAAGSVEPRRGSLPSTRGEGKGGARPVE